MEIEPDGSGVAAALGGLHAGQGTHARTHAYPRGAVVDRRGGGQEESQAQLHSPSAAANPLSRNQTAGGGAAAAHAPSRLSAPSNPQGSIRRRCLLMVEARAGSVGASSARGWQTTTCHA